MGVKIPLLTLAINTYKGVITMTIYYTYILTNSLDGQPFYVGKGSGSRMYQHVREAQRNDILKRSVHYKILSILDAGGDIQYQKFVCESESDAFEGEKLLIAQYGRKDIGTGILCNLTEGGEGASMVNPESVARRAEKHRGMKRSDDAKKRMSEAQRQIRVDGYVRTEETKRKMSADRKTRAPQSEETKAKRRASSPRKCPIQYDLDGTMIRKWDSVTEAARFYGVGPELISGCCTGRFKTGAGYRWGYEGKQEEFVRGKEVIQMDFGGNVINVWSTVRLAAKTIGTDPSNIINCCNGNISSSAGFVWKYK